MKNATLRVSVAVLGLLVVAAGQATATLIVGTGAGSGATTVNRTATFDNVTTGTSLVNYTEGGLTISTIGTAFEEFDPTAGNGGFNGHFYYPSGGAHDITKISATDNSTLFGVEFNLGTGFVLNTTFLHYEEVRGGVIVDSGTLTESSGIVVGFRDVTGFDQLRVGAYQDLATATTANDTTEQAIAVDNLKVDLTGNGGIATPEPSTIIAASLAGLIGLGYASRRRRTTSAA